MRFSATLAALALLAASTAASANDNYENWDVLKSTFPSTAAAAS